MQLGEGLMLSDLALIVPGVKYPLEITSSTSARYQRVQCHFGYLDLSVDTAFFTQVLARVTKGCTKLISDLRLHLDVYPWEGEGVVQTSRRKIPFTFRVGLNSVEDNGLLISVFDLRLFGPCPIAAPLLCALLTRSAFRTQILAGCQRLGASGLILKPIPEILRHTVPAQGFRLPICTSARLDRLQSTSQGVHLWFSSLPVADQHSQLHDEVYGGHLEGIRSFAQGEQLIAQGKLAAAERYYQEKAASPCEHSSQSSAQAFAQERLLSLLAARTPAHELALDVARELGKHRPMAALWAMACINQKRGQLQTAGEIFFQLGETALRHSEKVSAFQAFSASGRLFSNIAPDLANEMYRKALALRPDDCSCLYGLAEATIQLGDRAKAVQAYKRIATVADDPKEVAKAQVHLARLVLQDNQDYSCARLHLNSALQAVPDDLEALQELAQLSLKDGDSVETISLLEKVQQIAFQKDDRPLQAQTAIQAGLLWDSAFSNQVKAIGFFRQAVEIAPSWEAHFLLAQLLDRSEQSVDAYESYRQAVAFGEKEGNDHLDEKVRKGLHQAHHAMARLAKCQLKDHARANHHYKKALQLDSQDTVACRELLPLWRTEQCFALLARGCELCAASATSTEERGNFLAEAADVFAFHLQQLPKARELLEQALTEDAANIAAWEISAKLARFSKHNARLCQCLQALAELEKEPAAKVQRFYDLAQAAHHAGDNVWAAKAWGCAVEIDPLHINSLYALCSMYRESENHSLLGDWLSRLAVALEKKNSTCRAAEAWRELAQIYFQEGKNEQSLAARERAAFLCPLRSDFVEEYANLALHLGYWLKAKKAYQSLWALGAPRTPRTFSVSNHEHPRCIRLLLPSDQETGVTEDKVGPQIAALAAVMAIHPHEHQWGERLELLLKQANRHREQAFVRIARACAQQKYDPATAALHFCTAAQIFADLADTPAASKALVLALKSDPAGSTTAHALGTLLAKLRPTKAVSPFVLIPFAFAKDALKSLADLWESDRQEHLSATALPVVLQLWADQSSGSEKATILLRRCELLQKINRYQEAKETIGQVLQFFPRHRQALLVMRELSAFCDDHQGKALALKSLLELPQPDRKQAACWAVELGETLTRLGDLSGAQQALVRALEWDRYFLPAITHLFTLLVKQGAIKEALPLGEKVAQRTLDPAEAASQWFLLYQLASSLPERDLCLKYTRLAYQNAPQRTEIVQALANELYQSGSLSEVLPLYRQLVSVFDECGEDQDTIYENHVRLAELLLEIGEHENAQQVLAPVLESNPTYFPAVSVLYSTLRLAHPQKAVALFKKHAQALTPSIRSSRAFLQLAIDCKNLLSSPQEALEFLEKARQIAGPSIAIDRQCAELLSSTGDHVQCSKTWQRIARWQIEQGDLNEAVQAIDSFLCLEKNPSTDLRVDNSLRARLYNPLIANSSPARLLRILRKELAAIFVGNTAGDDRLTNDRIGPLRSPALAARVRTAQKIVGLEDLHVFLKNDPGLAVQLEAGEPDRLIVGVGLLEDPLALHFLLVRACELSFLGYPLAAKTGDKLFDLFRCILAANGRLNALNALAPPGLETQVNQLAERIKILNHSAEWEALIQSLEESLPFLSLQEFMRSFEFCASQMALITCRNLQAALRALLRLTPQYRTADFAQLPLIPAIQDTCCATDLINSCLQPNFLEISR